MKTGAPRSEPGAPDPRRDVEKILARHFIVLPPAVQFDINEEFLSEEELSQQQAVPAADLGVEPAEATHSAPGPMEPVADAEPTQPHPVVSEASAPSVDPAPPHPVVSEASPPSVDPAPPHVLVSEASAPSVDASRTGLVVPDVDESAAGTPSLSIAELLENSVSVDWHEAVAIAQRVCQALARDPAAGAHLCLVDPRHIEITQRGEVRVLTNEPGSDPHVKQVGRILRALLEGGTAPVQLRLLASQAAFEVPVFVSVDEFSEALRRFERPDQSDDIRMAFQRGLEAKFSASIYQGRRQAALPAPALAAEDPARAKPTLTDVVQLRVARPARSVRPPGATRSSRLAPAAVGSLLLIAAIALFSIRVGIGDLSGIGGQGSGIKDQESETLGPRIQDPGSLTSSPPPSRDERSAPIQAASAAVRPRPESPEPAPATPLIVPRSLARPAQGAARRVVAELEQRPEVGPSRETAPVSSQPASSSAGVSRPTVLNADSPDAVAHQGATLLASGRAEDARRVFDSIILANPMYQLDAARSTPEVVAALEASRRDILPALARRDYMNARAALDAGDYDRALSEGSRIATMLAHYDDDAAFPGLRSAVQQLLARASVLKAREDERVYSEADESVTPPAPLSRQLPATLPIGVTRWTVGTLEMLISREGEVETVKLHTPLNRYHERMIVSAAKAWRYRPASKDGKPVRFRLVTSINLPER